jgi:uncharacterized protein YndB with AHSA1/START domain
MLCVFVFNSIYCTKSKLPMAEKLELQLEFIINCSPKVLFNRLSTASGLSEWFADDVRVKGNLFTFVWEGIDHVAEKVSHKENKMVRYEWLDDSLDKEENYFEFVISQDDLTSDVSLLITDFAYEKELEETTDLWNTQITKLKQILGS